MSHCENIDGQCGASWCDCDYQRRKSILKNTEPMDRMSMSFLCGFLFAVAGLTLFLTQVATAELAKAWWTLQESVKTSFGHDTDIFPDHIP